VRLKLLGESLIAIRNTNGELGAMDEFCAHRGVSLWFGRNEENGIRCPYHGWKYDISGQCVDLPSDVEGGKLCSRIKLKSYPMVERGGIIWIYMGPADKKPPLPEWEFATVPTTHSFTTKRFQECNWLQALEGGIDSSHVSFLHRGGLKSDPLFVGSKGNEYNLNDLRPKFEVVDTNGGLLIGVKRKAEPGFAYWRVTPWIMPCFTMVPPRADHPIHGHFWVPIDDENCWAWSFDYHPTRPLKESEVNAMKNGAGIHCKYVPGTFMPLANKSNDYLIDRQKQKSGELYSGVEGIAIQDSSLQESMGPIQDRTKEHLTQTDLGIVRARRQLIAAAEALEKTGELPPGMLPEQQKIRSVAVVLAEDAIFHEAASDSFKAEPGKPHTTV
jgi:nitrite reductase/ring-hydroxylating ferredoxin subunit